MAALFENLYVWYNKRVLSMSRSFTLADLLSKVTVKDAVLSVALLTLAFQSKLIKDALKDTAHTHIEESREYGGNPGATTRTDIPFGFQ
jgi:hypothetical protein